MFLISTAYQKSKSKLHPDKQGRVIFRIAWKADDRSGWIERKVSSNLFGEQDTVIDINRNEIIRYIRLIYCIIEQYCNSRKLFTIDDVVTEIRRVINNDEEINKFGDRITTDFPLRNDIVSVGNRFKRDFTFIYPVRGAKPDKLLAYIQFLSTQAKSEGKLSMSRSYTSMGSSLMKFLNGSDLSFNEISRPFLDNYATWLNQNGVSESTQSFYLRTLRLVLNKAKDDGLINIEDSMFKGLNTKVVFNSDSDRRNILNNDELLRIIRMSFPDNPEAEMVRDMFLFGFYCRGMELVDVLNLTSSNIRDNVLRYNRRLKGLPVNINLDRSARCIISKYQADGSRHIFPLKDMYKGFQQYSISEIVRRHLKQIGASINIPTLTFSMNITTWKHLMCNINVSDMLLKSV